MYSGKLGIIYFLLFVSLIGCLILYFKKHPRMSMNEIESLINQLQNEGGNKEIRKDIIAKLEKIEITKKQQLFLLKAATYSYPETDFFWDDISYQLFSLAVKKPNEEFIGEIKNLFTSLSEPAKKAGLKYLLQNHSEKAIQTYMDIVRDHYMDLSELPTNGLEQKPQYVKLIFPEMYGYISNKKIASSIYLLVLNYLEQGYMNYQADESFKNDMIKDFDGLISILSSLSANMTSETGIWDNDDYLDARNKAEIIADLMGFIEGKDVLESLKRALNTNDKKVKFYTIISLLRHSQEVGDKHFISVASSSETRLLFYNKLEELGETSRFPEKYYNQEAFAESDMVNWLVYPTELARVPDDIELMKIATIDKYAFYLFRFRSLNDSWKDSGWMAGISGPYLIDDKPNAKSPGYTFSKFEKWDSKTPDEHIEDIIGTMNEWHSKEK